MQIQVLLDTIFLFGLLSLTIGEDLTLNFVIECKNKRKKASVKKKKIYLMAATFFGFLNCQFEFEKEALNLHLIPYKAYWSLVERCCRQFEFKD